MTKKRKDELEIGPNLRQTIDGKTIVELLRLGTVKRDGARVWSLVIEEKDLKDAKLKVGESRTFPIVALVEVLE